MPDAITRTSGPPWESGPCIKCGRPTLRGKASNPTLCSACVEERMRQDNLAGKKSSASNATNDAAVDP